MRQVQSRCSSSRNDTDHPSRQRRDFLKLAIGGGFGLAFGGYLIGCSSVADPTEHADLDLSVESGALNFAYAVIQLEVDFWSRVTSNVFPGMLVGESAQFKAFASALNAAQSDLQSTISSQRITDAVLFRLGYAVDFSDRNSTMTAARLIEDNAALGLYTLLNKPYLKTQVKIDQIATYAEQTRLRANYVRQQIAGAPNDITLAVTSPVTIMTALAPYYITTFTISNV